MAKCEKKTTKYTNCQSGFFKEKYFISTVAQSMSVYILPL